jgi:hypothetical protein
MPGGPSEVRHEVNSQIKYSSGNNLIRQVSNHRGYDGVSEIEISAM